MGMAVSPQPVRAPYWRRPGPTAPLAITLTDVNEAPAAITLSNASVDEHTDSSSGYRVGTLSTTDLDSGDTTTYTIVGGADAACFSIGGTRSDELVLSDGLLDYESQASYAVTVRITDSGGLTYDQPRVIFVGDQAEPPTIAPGPPGEPPGGLPPAPPGPVATPTDGPPGGGSPVTEDSEEPEAGSSEHGGSTGSGNTEEAPEEAPVDLALPPAEDLQGTSSDRDPDSGAGQAAESATLASLIKLISMRSPALVGELFAPSAATLPVNESILPIEVSGFVNELDSLREDIAADIHFDRTVVGSTIVASTGLSIGYVMWLVRGGALLSSVLSSLPAWRLADPLPVLAYARRRSEDDSLESLVKEKDHDRADTEQEVQSKRRARMIEPRNGS